MSKSKKSNSNDKDNYIILYNRLFEKSDFTLTPEEFQIYTLLKARFSPFLECTEMTIDHLASIQTFSKNSKKSERCKVVKKCLLKMEKLKVISILYDGELKNDTVLQITFPQIQGGYEEVKRELYDKTTDANEWYVLCIVQRFNKIGGYSKSLDKWSDVLQYSSKNTGITVVKGMEEKGLIHGVVGKRTQDKYGHWKQDDTKWFLGKGKEKNKQDLEQPNIVDVIDKEELSPEIVEESNVNIVIESKSKPQKEGSTDKQDTTETRQHNWYSKSELTVDDFVIYLTTVDEKLKEKAEKRKEAISKNEKGKYAMDKLLEEAEAKVRKINYEKEQQELREKEYELIQYIKGSNGNIVVSNEKEYKEISPNNVDDIKIDDSFLFVQVKEINELNGYRLPEPLQTEYIQHLPILKIIKEKSNQRLENSTIQILFEKVKQIIIENGIFTYGDSFVISQLREDILKKNNAGKKIEEPHEGDKYSYDPVNGEINDSLQERIFKHNREKNMEEEKRKQQEEEQFYKDLLN